MSKLVVHRRAKKKRRLNGRVYNVRRVLVSKQALRLVGLREIRCAYCGRYPHQAGKLTADHVIPKADGGADSRDNLAMACRDCNQRKGSLSVEEFLGETRTAAELLGAR